jgi:ribA/ribD-fused uncharacterized protein
MREVHFWKPEGKPYGALSNLFARPVVVGGIRYRSAEHAYKAAQARRLQVRAWLRNAPTAELVANAGEKLPKHETVKGWTGKRVEVMRRILKAKFLQHEDLRRLLLETGECRLVEWAPEDNDINRFWSEVRGSGVGQNRLGKLLMDLRRELRRDRRENR